MLMNRLERWMMNNPIRAGIQRHYASPIMARLGGLMDGGTALEIGCGNGVGAQIVLERFGASRVDAFDLDPSLVALAERRLSKYGDQARAWCGDTTSIDASDGLYDAVFGFGVVHHVPLWRDAVAEVARMRQGARFYSEESFSAFIDHPVWKRLLDHPREDRFNADEYCAALEQAGLQIVDRQISGGGGIGWVVAERTNYLNGAMS